MHSDACYSRSRHYALSYSKSFNVSSSPPCDRDALVGTSSSCTYMLQWWEKINHTVKFGKSTKVFPGRYAIPLRSRNISLMDSWTYKPRIIMSLVGTRARNASPLWKANSHPDVNVVASLISHPGYTRLWWIWKDGINVGIYSMEQYSEAEYLILKHIWASTIH